MRAIVRSNIKPAEQECFELVAILAAVKKAILKKADEITIELEYSKTNDFEIKRELMIHGFGK